MKYISSLWQVIKNILHKGEDGKQVHPRLGSRQLYERIVEYLGIHHQPILFKHKVTQIHHENFKITRLTLCNNETEQETVIDLKGQVISSIPLNILLKNFEPLPPDNILEQVKFLNIRNTVLVYLIVESSQLFPEQCLYVNDPTINLGRVTNFANWSEDMCPNTYQIPLCCEYWCNFNAPIWQQSEEEIINHCIQDLKAIGVLQNEKIFSNLVLKIPRTHPIYDQKSHLALSKIKSYLEQFSNLQIIGRYGAFKYYDQDGSLLMGIEAAENILTKMPDEVRT